MNNFYKVELTGDKVYYFRELTLNEYKNLQKACVDETAGVFNKFIDKFLNELIIDNDTSEFNTIDKLLACLYIRYYSISDTKTMISYFNGKQAKMPINLYSIIEKIKESIRDIDRITHVPVEGFMAEEVELDVFDFVNPIRAFIKDGNRVKYTEEMDPFIPASIFIEMNEHANKLMDKFNNVNLFEIDRRDGSKIRLDLANDINQIFTIIKIFLRDDLTSLYRNLYDLKTKVKIGFQEFDHITYSEYELYITQFNEEQKQNEQEMKQNSNKYIPED